MKWLSASTSNVAVVLLGLVFGLAGCASRQRPTPPPVHGYANLDQLARHHPGWSGVSQYDAALRRLEEAARRLPQSGRADHAMAALPALPSEAGLSAASPEDAAQVSRRLDDVQRSLLADLKNRRAMARAEQIQQKQNQWRQAARDNIAMPPETVNDQPDLKIQLLQANIALLTETVKNWNLSQPPTPKRNALQAQVDAEQAELAALLAEREQQKTAMQVQRQKTIQAVRDNRLSYVQKQTADLESQLRPVDERVIADQAARLTRQRTALMADLRRPVVSSVPTAGNAGAETLPRIPEIARASLSQASLRAAETRLRDQRARWIKFLRDDTQAAAQDAADQRGWDVTFGPPRPGDRDITAALTQAVTSSVWRL